MHDFVEDYVHGWEPGYQISAPVRQISPSLALAHHSTETCAMDHDGSSHKMARLTMKKDPV
jgi:hypothetical protein